ncbi:MAG: hemerythrin domain-containing protein [Desulfobacterota bacterium]|jgi:hemerythrin-like domain-containing protein|nr:hemerythrin domain-containing protein [Thermodesulfobacteriota bacterium]
MLPIGPLMIEHRLIEKMIALIRKKAARWEQDKAIDPDFIDAAVQFIRLYADQCHHGKEEDILFRDLSKKPLSPAHQQTMDELVEEHRLGRKTVAELVEAKRRYLRGEPDALPIILDRMKFLTEFYPRHIEKEDKHFFLPVMDYFTPKEKDALLQEGWEFDKNLIHQIFKQKVSEAENSELRD